MKTIAILLCLTALCSAETVTRVIDGDTFVLSDGRHIRIRGIDAPEMKQAGGKEARNELWILLMDRDVQLVKPKASAYERTEAVVSWRGYDMGLTMVARGWAWVDTRYVSGSTKDTYLEYQAKAQQMKRGLWAQDAPQAPWDFRKRVTSSLIGASPAPVIRRPVIYYPQVWTSGGT